MKEEPGSGKMSKGKKSSEKKYDDDYSDESEDSRFMDINDLKRRKEREAKSSGKMKK